MAGPLEGAARAGPEDRPTPPALHRGRRAGLHRHRGPLTAPQAPWVPPGWAPPAPVPLPAPLGRRIAARAIDIALGLLVLYVVSRFVPGERVLGRFAVGLGALSAYEALFVLGLGATPGKLATSLRVAELGRTEIDSTTAWIRGALTSLGTLAALLVPAALSLGVASLAGLMVASLILAVAGGQLAGVLSSPARRGFPDRTAGTVVVRHEAPALITGEDLGLDAGGRAQPMTAWGRVAPLDARRRARTARLDDSPLLVVALVAVIVAWAIDPTEAFTLFGVGVPATAAVLALLWVGLFVVDETWRIARDGGTAAHRREGLAVVDEQTGEPPGTRQALARAVVLAVFWLFPPLVPVTVVWMMVSADGQGPHDLVAGTIVVEAEPS